MDKQYKNDLSEWNVHKGERKKDHARRQKQNKETYLTCIFRFQFDPKFKKKKKEKFKMKFSFDCLLLTNRDVDDQYD